MSTTKSRKRRRAHLQVAYLQKRVIENTVDAMLDAYYVNPNHALSLCFGWFGRDRFQNVLRRFIHYNYAKTAFVLAVVYCIEHPKVMAVGR